MSELPKVPDFKNMVAVEWFNLHWRPIFAQLQSELDKANQRIKEEESACLQLIDERDSREDQINEIADLLGDFREWSSHNDRGENCLESIGILQDEISKQSEALKVLKDALGFYAHQTIDIIKGYKFNGDEILENVPNPNHAAARESLKKVEEILGVKK